MLHSKKKTVAIIGAMDEEINEVLSVLSDYQKKIISNCDFYLSEFNDKQIVVLKSGVGKVLSALATTVLFENFEIDYVINMGTAGGINRDINVFDIIVGDIVAEGDFDLTAFGYKLSFDEPRITVKTDRTLLDIAKNINLSNVKVGNIVSNDQFISNLEQVEKILNNFSSACAVDMEAGSIGRVCSHFGVPFIVFRGISDNVFAVDNKVEFEKYIKKASTNSANFCFMIIDKL